MVYSFLVSSYSTNIYFHGNRTFAGIPTEYHEPVKKKAANFYSYYILNQAFEKEYVTQQEFDETLAYKYPDGIPPKEELEQW